MELEGKSTEDLETIHQIIRCCSALCKRDFKNTTDNKIVE